MLNELLADAACRQLELLERGACDEREDAHLKSVEHPAQKRRRQGREHRESDAPLGPCHEMTGPGAPGTARKRRQPRTGAARSIRPMPVARGPERTRVNARNTRLGQASWEAETITTTSELTRDSGKKKAPSLDCAAIPALRQGWAASRASDRHGSPQTRSRPACPHRPRGPASGVAACAKARGFLFDRW